MTVKILCVAALSGCVPPPAPQTTPPPNVYVSSQATAGIDTSGTEVPCADCAPMTPQAHAVQVFPDKRIPRPTEVVGVLDFHSQATSENKGFDELRVHAAALGGDAVIGAEFEHGGGNEPSHLSGVVVRFLDRD